MASCKQSLSPVSSPSSSSSDSPDSRFKLLCDSLERLVIDDHPTAIETDSNDESPKDQYELADEFRADTKVSMQPILGQFFCYVCGCPAGSNCWTCEPSGHPLCNVCKRELKIPKCWSVVKRDKDDQLCSGVLLRLKSSFRVSQNNTIQVTCRYPGCDKSGVWHKIRKHQETCSFKS